MRRGRVRIRHGHSPCVTSSDISICRRIAHDPTAGGPHPLIVFAHGFALTPGTYSRLLRAWTRAGYVVAAPVFPLEDANAPGGPDESDLINEPQDVSVVISRLLTASA